ncbi:MAG: hypothetical protein A3J59_00705 [Candidatus Buchananbacteria bacterium RIFCSPHIGHO2_02_FULL_56_16]|uniref:UDP-N-acetylglucosamine kinase n=1 Tax=Candidatus Buchananbacteria bacterium RIFCSPHIGHO2_02_FULL_56_16 TaxID=1797542 RepID=A0A1G1YJA6_9BACT|nr:MAG: hypothetical protein A3J59_00705 [Candidatus Buchananbacteria bacterium RIFCSPHIGHO2_02_FULL_56_16]
MANRKSRTVKLEKPTLFAVGGIPGVGKSTVAKQIATTFKIKRFTTDNLKLAKQFRRLTAPYRKSGAMFPPSLRRRFYRQLADWGETELRRGRSVVLDATFSNAKLRSVVYRLVKVTNVRPMLIEIIKGELKDAAMISRMRRRHRADHRATPPMVYLTYYRYHAPFPRDWHRISNDGTKAELKKKVTDLLKKTLW